MALFFVALRQSVMSWLRRLNCNNRTVDLKQDCNGCSKLSSWTKGHYFQVPPYDFISLLTHMHSLVWITHVSLSVIGGGLHSRLFGCCQLGQRWLLTLLWGEWVCARFRNISVLELNLELHIWRILYFFFFFFFQLDSFQWFSHIPMNIHKNYLRQL